MNYSFDRKYRILQLLVNSIFRLNFRKIVCVGTENIPKDKPIIYAPSHRNALIDALVFVYRNIKQQVVFLGRADIFKKPLVAEFLTFIRIMPVYRMRDGKENLSKNSQVFEECGKLLQNGNPICLFPEGVYNPHQSLLQLKKAISKIVFPTESQRNFELDTHIVPVALHYIDKDGFLSDLYITYCEPIRVADYKELYKENENLAHNKIRNDMDARLRKEVVDIMVDEYYEQRFAFLEYNAERLSKKNFANKKDGIILAKQQLLKELKELEEKDPAAFEEKMEKTAVAIKKLKEHKIASISHIYKEKSLVLVILNYLLLLITAPVALAGLLNSIIPIGIYRKMIAKIKDKQFISSIRVAVGIFVAPIAYLLQALIVGLIFHNFLIAFIYFIISPIVLYLGSYWRRWWKNNNIFRRITQMRSRSPKDWNFITVTMLS